MFEEQIERIIALQEGAYWIALEQEALPLLLEMQAKLNDLQKRVDAALEILKYCDWHSMVKDSIKILTGEGEVTEIGTIWKHYKGELYRFVTACDCESTGKRMAVYESLKTGARYVRPMDEFIEKFTLTKEKTDAATEI